MKVWTFVVGEKASSPLLCDVPYSNNDKLELSNEAVMVFSDTNKFKAFFYKQDLLGYYIRVIPDEKEEVKYARP